MTDSTYTTTSGSPTGAAPPARVSIVRASLTIAAKDLRAELRGRELINAMTLFAALAVLIFSFALDLDVEARETAIAGVFWVTVIFAGMLGLNRSLGAEQDKGNLDALLLAPIPRGALFFGKMLSNLVLMLIVALLISLLATVLFNISMFRPWLLLTALLGMVGFAAVGTLLASMAVHARTRETLLPILLLPVRLPIVMTAVRASTAILTRGAQSDWVPWLQMLAVADVVLLALSYILFDFVVEE